MTTLLVLCLALCLPAIAAADDYGKGWCEGVAFAAKANDDNRTHFRRLVGAPVKTHEDVLASIFTHNWIGPLAPRTLRHVDEPEQWGPSLVDALDLYVFWTPSTEEIPHVWENGQTIKCPSGERTMR